MGYDLVTWSPRLGSTGDDVYNVSGARKLDGTIDTGSPTGIKGGDASGFSTTPTIAQLNASAGLNQVIGLYNRRASSWNTLAGTALSTISYVSQGGYVAASDFTNILSKINTLRSAEGWTGGALAWPIDTPTSGANVRGDHLAYLRKALAISGTITQTIGGSAFTIFSSNVPGNLSLYSRVDNPYNTHTSETDDATVSGSFNNIYCGKSCPSPTAMDRFRILTVVYVPDWATTIASGSMTLGIANITTTLEACLFDIVITAPASGALTMGVSGYDGSAYGSQGSILFNATPSVGTNAYALGGLANLSAVGAGKKVILNICQNNDFNNTGAGISSGNHSYFQLSNVANEVFSLTF